MAYAVRLSLAEFLLATEVAGQRMRASGLRGLNAKTTGRDRDLLTRLHDDVLGCASELAVAKWLGIEWTRSVNTFRHLADVGEDIDVRCTDRADGRLILRERDHPYRWFILVTGRPPTLVLRGWIRGEDAMVPEWLGNPHGWGSAWLVPQVALIPITEDGVVPPCLRQVPQQVSARGA